MKLAGRIDTIDLFPTLDRMLIELLHSLEPEAWNLPTRAGVWTVKDVAAHLLDGNLRSISASRDGHQAPAPGPFRSYPDLVAFLNDLNADWIKAMQRLSPQVLIVLLEVSNDLYYQHLRTLAPDGEALYAVSWAGDTVSPNWFHIAREYMEKWHHQQQIREAAGDIRELLSQELYFPFLETGMRALPHHYRNVEAPEGTTLHFTVKSIEGDWFLVREAGKWELYSQYESSADTRIVIPCEIAWQVFTKGISKEDALRQIRMKGKVALGKKIADMLAVMA